jgi:large subunit ribosomal protein L7Ae
LQPRTKQTQPGKKITTAPASTTAIKKGAAGKKGAKKQTVSLTEARPRVFSVGGDLQHKRDLTRFVKWPRYIRVQRQRRILLKRLKVPPVINQFTKTLDKNAATLLFKLLHSHRPETPAQKKARLLAAAQDKAGGQGETKKPNVIKYGLKHITGLVEQKKAKLVVIAHDVEPIELVMWLPTLCRKKGIPYVIVKGKARLGQVVGKKTASALAFVNVDTKDKTDFANLVQIATDSYLNAYEKTMKTRGGLIMGGKHLARQAKKARLVRKAEAPK